MQTYIQIIIRTVFVNNILMTLVEKYVKHFDVHGFICVCVWGGRCILGIRI